jgi:hypothetical protein
MEFVTASPAAKRMRACHDDFGMALSPGVVSITPSDCNTAVVMDTCTKASWWKQASEKQKNPRVPMLGESDLVCHVCESIYTTNATEISVQPQYIMPANSLLAYFSCGSADATKNNAYKKVSMPVVSEETARATCTFCERDTCSKCLTNCEECEKSFCTFCLTNDYWGSFARVVCLDCSPEQAESNDNFMKL